MPDPASDPVLLERLRRLYLKRVGGRESGVCWEWPANQCDKGGYGCLEYYVKSKRYMISAHRLAHLLYHGPIPDGMEVMHACDNRPCCNPAHLSAGTHLENEQDKVAKGRSPRGEQKSLSLTDEEALEMRGRHRAGDPIRLLAREYDVTYDVAYGVCKGTKWKYLKDEDVPSLPPTSGLDGQESVQPLDGDWLKDEDIPFLED